MDGRMVEEWRDIPGFDGDYQVSSLGRVRSLKRNPEGRILKSHIDRYGYSQITLLVAPNKLKTFTVHKLVALAFIEKLNDKNEIDHIDMNKQNNAVENLRWCDRNENMKYTVDAGIWKNRSMRVKAVSPDGEVYRFESQHEAGRFIGIGQSLIWRCIMKKQDSSHGWHFYKEEE